jgi:predicted metal-dependent phosphotriesterase family hydrolase
MTTTIISDTNQAEGNARTLLKGMSAIDHLTFSPEIAAADGVPPADHDQLSSGVATMLDGYASAQGRDVGALKTIAKKLDAADKAIARTLLGTGTSDAGD